MITIPDNKKPYIGAPVLYCGEKGFRPAFVTGVHRRGEVKRSRIFDGMTEGQPVTKTVYIRVSDGRHIGTSLQDSENQPEAPVSLSVLLRPWDAEDNRPVQMVAVAEYWPHNDPKSGGLLGSWCWMPDPNSYAAESGQWVIVHDAPNPGVPVEEQLWRLRWSILKADGEHHYDRLTFPGTKQGEALCRTRLARLNGEGAFDGKYRQCGVAPWELVPGCRELWD